MMRDDSISTGNSSGCTPLPDETGNRLQLRWYESTGRTEAMRLWNQLADSLAEGPSLSCSPGWVEPWLDQFGDLVPHRFVAGYSGDGTLRGMALLCEGVEEHEGPFAVRTLHLGTAGEPEADSVVVEYNRLLADSRWHPLFLRDVLSAMAEDSSCDELRLDGFSLNDFTAISKSLKRLKLREEVRTVTSWYFDLDATRAEGTDVISQLSYSTRKHLRKNLRWYTSEGQELTGQWSETVEQAEDIFHDMVRLHQQRWEAAGHPGVYASERFTRFHRELIRRLVPTGQMALFRVMNGKELVGCVQLMIDGRRVLAYQGGFAAYDSKNSPGIVVDYLCISECLKRGYAAFDFLGGDSSHKQKLSTDSAKLVWVRLKHPRLKYAFARAGRLLKYGSRSAPSAAPQTGSIRVREVNSLEELAPLREDWNRLLAGTAGASWLQSCEWFLEHQRLYCSSTRMRVLVVEDEGRPIGIVPLVLKSVHTPVGELSCLTWPTDDWGTFYGPITDDPTFVLIHALQYLRWAARDWDVLELRNIDLEGRDRGRTRTAIEACSMTSHESTWDTSAVIDLTGSWEDYLAARPEGWAKKLHRCERLLQEAGALEYVRYRPAGAALDDDDLRDDLYAECEEVASRSGPVASRDGVVLCHPNTGQLLRAVHERAVAAGSADLNLLRLNGRPIAFRYNVHFGGCVNTLRSGGEPDGSVNGAELVLMARWLEDSFHRGDRVIDLGPGGMEGKQPWLTRTVQSYRYTKFSTLSPRAQLLTWSSWFKANVRQAMVAAGDRYLGLPQETGETGSADSARSSAGSDSAVLPREQPVPAGTAEPVASRSSE